MRKDLSTLYTSRQRGADGHARWRELAILCPAPRSAGFTATGVPLSLIAATEFSRSPRAEKHTLARATGRTLGWVGRQPTRGGGP